MDLHHQIALVTGANRGLGAHLVDALLAADVTRVYAAARSPERIARHVVADPRVVAVRLDVTDEASVRAAATAAPDVTVLVNNAGSLAFGGVVEGDLDGARRDLETNYIGTLRVIRTFLPGLQRAAPAAVVNILTLIALAPVGPMAGYSASKAAAHSMTQALRAAVRERGVHVLAAYPGGIDTDMLAGVEAVKAPPADVARQIVEALAADREVVFPDEASAAAGEVYATDPYTLERMLAG
jgi:NAD(P)-dependent dehydrogenase (short-subunit alcohol dehydrogenase family)